MPSAAHCPFHATAAASNAKSYREWWPADYGQDDAHGKLVEDFVAAWNKVMNADRFDFAQPAHAAGACSRQLMIGPIYKLWSSP